MNEHLSKEARDRLISRELQPDELLAASRHLAVCAECRQKVGDARDIATTTTFLASDLPGPIGAGDSHLDYEQLEGFVDERLTPAQHQQASEHLGACDSCAREVKELRLLAKHLASYPQVTAEKAGAPFGRRPFQGLAGLFEFRKWQFAGLAAALLLAALVGLLLWQSRKQPQLAGGNQDGQTKAPDKSNQGTEGKNALSNTGEAQAREGNDKGANTNGEAAKSTYDAVVATAISKQTLATPPALKDLNGKPVTLLGPSDPAQKFDLLSPRGTVVQSPRPTLHWQALAGAESYKVYLLNTNFDVLQKSDPLSGRSWTVIRPLDRGQIYIWQVVAIKDGKEIAAPVAPAKEARFKVLDSKSTQAVQQFAQENQDNHLALGIIYAHHGLLDEAEAQLSAAARLKQSPELARRFLHEIKALRR